MVFLRFHWELFSGILLSVLPMLYFFAKPLVGMLADYFAVIKKVLD